MKNKIEELVAARAALVTRLETLRGEAATVEKKIADLVGDSIPDDRQIAQLSDLRTKHSLYGPAVAEAEQKLESLSAALRKLIDEAGAELDRWARQEAAAGQAALKEALRGILENEEDVRAASAEYSDWTKRGRAARRLQVQVSNLRTLLPGQFDVVAKQLAEFWGRYQAAKQPAA